jgi:hypothetical protein
MDSDDATGTPPEFPKAAGSLADHEGKETTVESGMPIGKWKAETFPP